MEQERGGQRVQSHRRLCLLSADPFSLLPSNWSFTGEYALELKTVIVIAEVSVVSDSRVGDKWKQ